jgi:hypothetical protein
MIGSLSDIARALGGEVAGGQALAPGPGHSPKDRSMCVRLSPNGRRVPRKGDMIQRRAVCAADIALALGCKTAPDAAGNFQCRCPGPLHRNGDRTPSLSVKDGRNGWPILFCFAGCDYRDIATALERRGISLRARS